MIFHLLNNNKKLLYYYLKDEKFSFKFDITLNLLVIVLQEINAMIKVFKN
jgi:hypothetical protein